MSGDPDLPLGAETLFVRHLASPVKNGPSLEELCDRYPEHAEELLRMNREQAQLGDWIGLTERQSNSSSEPPGLQPTVDLRPGQILDDYLLVRPIGQGGMGSVWLAEQQSLRRPVALKFLRDPLLGDRSRSMFEREAQAGARLTHPGLITTYAYGQTHGRPWIAMEYVPGEVTLRDVLEARRRDAEPVAKSDRRVLRLLIRVAQAMQAAHEADVIHRDLKPENILITRSGEPRVTDFGLARLKDQAAVSVTGQLLGTAYYMSPEQARGEASGVGALSDVFSFGVLLYECLTGERPFKGDTLSQVVEQITNAPTPSMLEVRSTLPRDLDTIVKKCLEKQPRHRYSSMSAAAEDLERFLNSVPILARPPGVVRRVSLWARRHPVWSVGLTITAASTVILTLALGATLRAERGLEMEVAAVKRLSSIRTLEGLLTRSEALWPATPELMDEFRDWIDTATALVADLPVHRAQRDLLLERVAARTAERARGNSVTGRDEADDLWWLAQLEALIQGLEELSDEKTGLLSHGLDPTLGWGIPRRLEFAADLESASVTDPEVAEMWRAAATRVASNEDYNGIVLRPQLGLVPLGADPLSGFEEFAHLQTGIAPSRDETGALEMMEECGVVLVLVPGGEFLMGCHALDSLGDRVERPQHAVELTPFLISKYEMTQAQWTRVAGSNPSYFRPGEFPFVNSYLHPVESIDWTRARTVLARASLVLPSEAQWEYAARGGTSSRWWTGNRHASLIEDGPAANCTEQGTLLGPPNTADGFEAHGPVDALRPNPFGLHMICGNVWEWCEDTFADEPIFYERSPRVDPVCTIPHPQRVLRGSGHSWDVYHARSSSRKFEMAGAEMDSLGVRPAMRLAR